MPSKEFLDQMCASVKEHERFTEKFVNDFDNDSVRKVIKRLRKQYHIDEVSKAGETMSFCPDTGESLYDNTSGCKYRIRYWHWEEGFGKAHHFYCFDA